jgi:hypothetical protein
MKPTGSFAYWLHGFASNCPNKVATTRRSSADNFANHAFLFAGEASLKNVIRA